MSVRTLATFSGSDPIGVLIGAKRPSGTLIHKIAVHPDHRRQGHGRHLLASLSSKLAILGPPRMIAEVPETLAATCGLFDACGYVQEALLTDYVLYPTAQTTRRGGPEQGEEPGAESPRSLGAGDSDGGFVIPVTIDDLAANGLLGAPDPSTPGPVCWERSVETLTARKDDIAGLAIASDERIEACLLYVERGVGPEGNAEAGPHASPPPTEIVALRSFVEDGGARLAQLLSHLRARGMATFRFPKVHPEEVSKELLETLGFRAAGGHLLYAARARSE